MQAYRVGERLYATQFHPEPTTRAFTERMAVYRDDGYFAAERLRDHRGTRARGIRHRARAAAARVRPRVRAATDRYAPAGG